MIQSKRAVIEAWEKTVVDALLAGDSPSGVAVASGLGIGSVQNLCRQHGIKVSFAHQPLHSASLTWTCVAALLKGKEKQAEIACRLKCSRQFVNQTRGDMLAAGISLPKIKSVSARDSS